MAIYAAHVFGPMCKQLFQFGPRVANAMQLVRFLLLFPTMVLGDF